MTRELCLDFRPVSTEEQRDRALTVRCPACDRREGRPCLVVVTSGSPTEPFTEMAMPHMQRLDDADRIQASPEQLTRSASGRKN